MKGRILLALSLLLGVALLVWVVRAVGVADALTALRRAGPGAALALAVNGAAILALQTAAWSILLRSAGHPVAFRVLLAAMVMGYAMSFLTPSMYLGGEPIRTVYIARRSGLRKRLVLGTILVQKFAELASFLVLCWFGSAAVLHRYRADLGAGALAGLVAFDLLAGAALGALCWSFLTRAHWSARLLRSIARRGWWRPAAFEWAAGAAADMEEVIYAAFHARLRATLAAAGLMFASLLLVFLRPAFFFCWLPDIAPFDLTTLGVFFVFTQLLMAFHVTPGGVGFYEAGFVAVFHLLAVPLAGGLAYTALARGVELSLTGLGILRALSLGLAGAQARAQALAEARQVDADEGAPPPAA
ncbi:MAG: flippase-like domain-containing protein [Planctomycetes bacterium]|nr:flippase-like domain-containing protein [Planctomycetota bacterium]